MNSNQTLTEAHNYLIYIADALHSVSQKYSIEKQDRVILEKYAEDLIAYAKSLDKLKNNMILKEKMKKEELEQIEEK